MMIERGLRFSRWEYGVGMELASSCIAGVAPLTSWKTLWPASAWEDDPHIRGGRLHPTRTTEEAS